MNPCVPNVDTGKTCLPDAESYLAKMELFILYNTESFNKRDASMDPISRDSVIQHFDFNPAKRYELKSVITQGKVDENRSLYRTSSADFFQMEVGSLKESVDPAQSSYIAGSIGLSLDRIHVERTHYNLWDLLAYAGGVAVTCYFIIFVLVIVY